MRDDLKLTIREAQPPDIEDLATLYIGSAKYHYALNPRMYIIPSQDIVISDIKEGFKKSKGKKDSLSLVAEYKGKVVGCIGIRLHRNEKQRMIRAELSAELDISVREDMRGLGIGTQLIQAAEKWAQKRGADRVLLNTYAENKKAINFYSKHNYYQIIGVLLAKTLKKTG